MEMENQWVKRGKTYRTKCLSALKALYGKDAMDAKQQEGTTESGAARVTRTDQGSHLADEK